MDEPTLEELKRRVRHLKVVSWAFAAALVPTAAFVATVIVLQGFPLREERLARALVRAQQANQACRTRAAEAVAKSTPRPQKDDLDTLVAERIYVAERCAKEAAELQTAELAVSLARRR